MRMDHTNEDGRVQRGWVPFDEPFPTQLEKFKERRKKETGFGYLSKSDLTFVLSEDPMVKLLIRHSMGRLICPAQDAKFIIGCIERHPKGFIRSMEFYEHTPRRS